MRFAVYHSMAAFLLSVYAVFAIPKQPPDDAKSGALLLMPIYNRSLAAMANTGHLCCGGQRRQYTFLKKRMVYANWASQQPYTTGYAGRLRFYYKSHDGRLHGHAGRCRER